MEFFEVLNKWNPSLQITTLSKISYAVMQFVHCLYPYRTIYEMRGAVYTLSKFILTYQPERVWKALLMEGTNLDVLQEIKDFISYKIKQYEGIEIKTQENISFNNLLKFLNGSWRDRIIIKREWDYRRISKCLRAYLRDTQVCLNPELYIDNGNKNLNTALIEDGFKSQEADSKEYCGIRACDIISNLIGRLLVAMKRSLTYESEEDCKNYKKLDKAFFDLNEVAFGIYHRLFELVINDSSYYTVCSDYYFDSVIMFVTLLHYFNQYKDFSEFKKISIVAHQEKFDTMIVSRIQEELKI